MGTTTIRLDRSAYDLLRSRKWPDESFSEEIHRLLGAGSPGLKKFLALLPRDDASDVADKIEAARAEELEVERRRSRRRSSNSGHRR